LRHAACPVHPKRSADSCRRAPLNRDAADQRFKPNLGIRRASPPEFRLPRLCWLKATFPGTGTSDPRLSPRRKPAESTCSLGQDIAGQDTGCDPGSSGHSTAQTRSFRWDASRLTRKLNLDWGRNSRSTPGAYLVGLKRSAKRESVGRNAAGELVKRKFRRQLRRSPLQRRSRGRPEPPAPWSMRSQRAEYTCLSHQRA
jgi:hypothetical protein